MRVYNMSDTHYRNHSERFHFSREGLELLAKGQWPDNFETLNTVISQFSELQSQRKYGQYSCRLTFVPFPNGQMIMTQNNNEAVWMCGTSWDSCDHNPPLIEGYAEGKSYYPAVPWGKVFSTNVALGARVEIWHDAQGVDPEATRSYLGKLYQVLVEDGLKPTMQLDLAVTGQDKNVIDADSILANTPLLGEEILNLRLDEQCLLLLHEHEQIAHLFWPGKQDAAEYVWERLFQLGKAVSFAKQRDILLVLAGKGFVKSDGKMAIISPQGRVRAFDIFLTIQDDTAVSLTENMPQQGPKSATNNIYVSGDYIVGDKIGGDKIVGDKTTVGNISNSTDIVVGPGASVNEGTDPEDGDTAVSKRQWLPQLSDGLNFALIDGYYDGEVPPKDSLVKKFTRSERTIEQIEAHLNLFAKEYPWWTAQNGVSLSLHKTVPPSLDFPAKRWHIRKQHIQATFLNLFPSSGEQKQKPSDSLPIPDAKACATLEIYEVGLNKVLVCFFDGFNAISAPHACPRLGQCLLDYADFIEQEINVTAPDQDTAVTGQEKSVEVYDDTAVSIPNDSTLTPEDQKYRSELLKILKQYFNDEEDLRILYFELGWTYGKFESGGTDTQARALVERCFREARQNELADLITQHRSNIKLPKSPE